MDYKYTAETEAFYIHWPFCPYRCHFCPFVALSGQDHLMKVYHEALKKEISAFKPKNAEKLDLKTIYIGGGTPSTWPNDLLLDMFGTLESTYNLKSISEITLEVNPGTVEKNQIPVWQQAGITRLSIGVQSLNDQVLKELNRHQKKSDVYQLLKWTQGKFNSISVDVIIGMPGVSEAEWKGMIQEIVTWPIQHISMYFLSIHENTPLYTRLMKNELKLPPQDPVVDLYYWTVEQFEKYGLYQYEISSFARKGYESQHNQVYWVHKPYKGFGIGACSFDGTHRFQNQKNVMRYMQLMEKNESVNASTEQVTQEQKKLEVVMLGLRQMKGLSIEAALSFMTKSEQSRFLHNVKDFELKGLITTDSKRIYLNKSVLAVENEVALRLLK